MDNDSRISGLAERDAQTSGVDDEADRDGQEQGDTGEPDGPAFPFDAEDRWSIYARRETKEAFQDAVDLEIVPDLREYGIRDLTQREVHDAMVQFAAENPGVIAERVASERGYDTKQDD